MLSEREAGVARGFLCASVVTISEFLQYIEVIYRIITGFIGT